MKLRRAYVAVILLIILLSLMLFSKWFGWGM